MTPTNACETIAPSAAATHTTHRPDWIPTRDDRRERLLEVVPWGFVTARILEREGTSKLCELGDIVDAGSTDLDAIQMNARH